MRIGKDKTEKWDFTGVVYKLTCKNCTTIYIGETKSAISICTNEYINKKSPEPVVSLHMDKYNHKFYWDNTCILHRENHNKKRQTAEMIFINGNNNSINKKEDIYLNHIYKPLLSRLKYS